MADNFGCTPNRARRRAPSTGSQMTSGCPEYQVKEACDACWHAPLVRLCPARRIGGQRRRRAQHEPVPACRADRRGRTQARALGAQLAGLHVDLAVGTRLLRTQQTIDLALHGRPVPTLIEPGFDEIRAGDLDGARIDAYRSWR